MSLTIAPATQQRSRPDQTARHRWISTPARTGGRRPDEPAIRVRGLRVSVLPRSRPHLFDILVDGRVKAVQNSRGERKRRRERPTVCSPRRGWRGAKMERHSEMRSVRASTAGERQAASRQFVFLGRGEGMSNTELSSRRHNATDGEAGLPAKRLSKPVTRGTFVVLELGGGRMKRQSRQTTSVSMSLRAISNPQLK